MIHRGHTVPVKRIRAGSGITEHKLIQISEPFGDEEIAALHQLFGQDFTFEGSYGGPAERLARETLEAVGITSNREVKPDGSMKGGWSSVVAARGFKADSEQDYAARLLETLQILRREIRLRREDGIARFAYQLGALVAEAKLKFQWEHDALAGRKSHEGARLGHEKIHGTKKKKEARWRSIANGYHKLVAAGGSKKSAVYTIAAEKKCNERTVRRAVSWAAKHPE